MNKFHEILRTWADTVDYFFVLTNYGKNIFIKAGLPPSKLVVKPNIIYPEPRQRDKDEIQNYALFLGQLSKKKGIEILVDVWKEIDFKLIVAGNGPLLERLREKANNERSKIEFIGAVPHSQAIELLKKASFLILPSLHIEGFPLVISEAMALGVPVITSNSGPLTELVEDMETGLLTQPGNINDLRAKIIFALKNKELLVEIGNKARIRYEKEYNAKKNYDIMINVYRTAIKLHKMT
jgi:glycosyltransferase involved in cell wall biosynthesis